MEDDQSLDKKALMPADSNKQLSLPAEIVNRGLELATKIELKRNIQVYQKPIRYFAGINAQKSCIAFSRNGEFAAITHYGLHVGSGEPDLTIWETKSGNITVLSTKGRGLYFYIKGGKHGNVVLKEKLYFIYSVALSSSGDIAIAGYNYETIVGWDVKNRYVRFMIGGQAGEPRNWTTSLVFSPDDRYFAEATENVIRLRDSKTRTVCQQIESHISWFNQVAFSNDGSKLLIGKRSRGGSSMALADVRGIQEPLSLGGNHVESHNAVAIFPDSQKLLTLNDDGVIGVWNAVNGEEISRWSHAKSRSDVNDIVSEKQLSGNLKIVMRNPIIWGLSSVAISPDGNRILSGGGDTYMRLWTPDGQEICEYPHNTQVAKVAFLPDGQHALSGCWDGSVYLWELPPQ